MTLNNFTTVVKLIAGADVRVNIEFDIDIPNDLVGVFDDVIKDNINRGMIAYAKSKHLEDMHNAIVSSSAGDDSLKHTIAHHRTWATWLKNATVSVSSDNPGV